MPRVFNGFGPGTRGPGSGDEPLPSRYKPDHLTPAGWVYEPLPSGWKVPINKCNSEVLKPELPAFKSTELSKMPDDMFQDLLNRTKREMERRVYENKCLVFGFSETRRKELFDGFNNFLLGAAHAMACRAALRLSAGHHPFGKTPVSGTPWHALDGHKLDKAVGSPIKIGTPPVTLCIYRNPLDLTFTKAVYAGADARKWLLPRYLHNECGYLGKYDASLTTRT